MSNYEHWYNNHFNQDYYSTEYTEDNYADDSYFEDSYYEDDYYYDESGEQYDEEYYEHFGQEDQDWSYGDNEHPAEAFDQWQTGAMMPTSHDSPSWKQKTYHYEGYSHGSVDADTGVGPYDYQGQGDQDWEDPDHYSWQIGHASSGNGFDSHTSHQDHPRMNHDGISHYHDVSEAINPEATAALNKAAGDHLHPDNGPRRSRSIKQYLRDALAARKTRSIATAESFVAMPSEQLHSTSLSSPLSLPALVMPMPPLASDTTSSAKAVSATSPSVQAVKVHELLWGTRSPASSVMIRRNEGREAESAANVRPPAALQGHGESSISSLGFLAP